MKKTKLFWFLIFYNIVANAQYTHRISISEPFHADFFNHEKEKLNARGSHFSYYLPAVSYMIGKGRYGVEAYFTQFYRVYHKDITMDGQILDINYAAFGINYSYTFLDKKAIRLRGLGGVNYGVTHYNIVLATFNQGNSVFDAILGGGRKWNFGLQTGVNATAPIWKGLYANGNVRYTFHPKVDYEEHRQNLLLEIGLGYRFGQEK